ncbi:MAG: type 4a pilus biogenesis protein PilO [Candidatus Doudnabacteria bacterium]|nr:type 4a pilus biogenesis protein PilO [Candidatus Doudnabacteria bacterium]
MTEGRSAKSYSLLSVALIFGCLIVAYFLFTKYWTNYTFAKAQEQNMLVENARLKQALQDSESYLDTFTAEGENISKLKLALPDKDSDMANFVYSVSQLATSSGVALTNFTVSTTQGLESAPNSIAVENLGFNVSGSYLAFQDFLTKLQDHLRLIDIYHITFNGTTTEGSKTPILEYSVKLRTYYQN